MSRETARTMPDETRKCVGVSINQSRLSSSRPPRHIESAGGAPGPYGGTSTSAMRGDSGFRSEELRRHSAMAPWHLGQSWWKSKTIQSPSRRTWPMSMYGRRGNSLPIHFSGSATNVAPLRSRLGDLPSWDATQPAGTPITRPGTNAAAKLVRKNGARPK